MKATKRRPRGFMAVALAVTVAGIIWVLSYAIKTNLGIFLSTFNRNKAFYDAEVVIEKLGLEIQQAYQLAQRVPSRGGPTGGICLGDATCAANILGGVLYFPAGTMCVDRSDNTFAGTGAGRICVTLDAANIQIRTLTVDWRLKWKAFQYALLKTIVDMTAPSVAEAQYIESFRPNLPASMPSIARTYDLNANPNYVERPYNRYDCVTGQVAANTPVRHCVTFRFCVKFVGDCADPAPGVADEWVRQTVILSATPSTDVED